LELFYQVTQSQVNLKQLYSTFCIYCTSKQSYLGY